MRRQSLRDTLRVAGLVGLLLLCAGRPVAHAGMMAPCAAPMVLPTPRVQVFLLPYSSERPLSAQGRELATILQRHVLFAALKYSSIAVEELTQDSFDCNYDRVATRVLPKLKAGQVAIFLWGRLFEQGGNLQLQSTVAYAMVGQTDTITWDIPGLATKATTTLPADPVLFAPRVIPLDLLSGLQGAQREANRVHREPNQASAYVSLPRGRGDSLLFEVLGTRNDWMHVRLLPNNTEGWIWAEALAPGEQLKGTFPELFFVDGQIGYNELRQEHAAGSEPLPERVVSGTFQSLNRYLDLASSRAESDAKALAGVLVGNTRWLSSRKELHNTSALEAAARSYRAAQRIAPTSTVTSSFRLACDLKLCTQGSCGEGADTLHSEFLAAVAQDPTSNELLNNLGVLYQAAAKGYIKLALSGTDIARQQALVDRARGALGQGTGTQRADQ